MEANNAVAMREALEAALPIMRHCPFTHYNTTEVDAVVSKMEAALALPRRQCDVGTTEEQLLRFEKHCNNYNEYCDGCPLPQIWHRGDMIGKCRLAWAQMPYEAEKGGAS